LLNFGKRFSNFSFLESHDYTFDKSYECIAAAGQRACIVASPGMTLEPLQSFIDQHNDWIFGHLAYDLKNQTETLSSKLFDGIGFPDYVFYVPEMVFIITNKEVSIGVLDDNTDKLFFEINTLKLSPVDTTSVNLVPRISTKNYIETVQHLQEHIARGDCYEICFCQEMYAEKVQIDPVQVFQKLNRLSANPFAAYYQFDDKHLLCASPERFLKKTNNSLISQPIKGTAKRSGLHDEEETETLRSCAKERSENTMIVDLVRNDLSKICISGSVKVKEFMQIYSFPQVHQMISTVAGTIEEGVNFTDIIKATFPMGSMTGAPKKRVMELIEQYEKTKRGLYSGSVGYITPEKDFDFNVVIRSILYNSSQQYVSVQSGSAITAASDAQKEAEECEIKISAMQQALS
jgi:para-aminobenzoate synthetase component I